LHYTEVAQGFVSSRARTQLNCEYLHYFLPNKNIKKAPENMKKPPSNVAHNFSALPTGPKAAQISFSVP
jgi:hypothetical protein